MFPRWQIYNRLFGKIDWVPNMGKTMRGVRAEYTPVGQQEFYPTDIDQTPNKNVYEVNETTEDTVLKMHDFDSKQLHFLPSFQDFRENQLDFAHKDIIQQIAVSNDLFIRSAALQKTPFVFIPANRTGAQLVSAPVTAGGSITSANAVKNTAWFQSIVPKIGTNLSLAALDYAVAVLRDDLGAPFFEGVVNTPKDNELIKGRYVLVGSSECYQQFKWDPNFSQFRNINLSIVNDGFRGSIFDEVTFKTERYPLRFAADGTRPAPETTILDPAQTNPTDNPTGGNASGRTRPNPDYVNAPYEVAWLLGADAFKTIKVGPPPRAFSAKKLDMAKFYAMKWNGEVQLTDQLLVKYGDGTYDTNVRGRFLKLISTAIMGMIPCNQYNCLPIMYARKRVAVV